MSASTSSLGTFSVSLAVNDLQASREFYSSLGFEIVGGDPAMNYVILANGAAKIGLFQGMFEDNILTFNPGWDSDANALDSFTDVREWQKRLEAAGVAFASKADPDSSGPASFVITDPDGNTILVDQHV